MLPPTKVYLWTSPDFDPKSSLPADLIAYGDFANYFVHLLYSKLLASFDADDDTFIRLKFEYMAEKFPGDRIYKKVRDALLTADVIECDNKYIVDEKAYGYRLGKRIRARRFRKIEANHKKLKSKLGAKEKKSMPKNKVHREIYRFLHMVKIDIDAAIAEIEALVTDKDKRKMCGQADWIHELNIYCEPDSYGRLHHNLSNLKKCIRKHLTVNGEKLCNVDVRNSQPLIFGLVVRDNLSVLPPEKFIPCRPTINYFAKEVQDFEDEDPIDVSAYIDLTQKGQFYEFLMKYGDIPLDQRETLKVDLYEGVLFGPKTKDLPITQIFKELFPNVFHIINILKTPDYKVVAHMLQRVESEIILGGVCAEIMKELPDAWFSTVHDSILTLPRYADCVARIIEQEFQKRGLNPTLKKEFY